MGRITRHGVQIEIHSKSFKSYREGDREDLSSVEGIEKIALTTCSTINPSRKGGGLSGTASKLGQLINASSLA